MNLKLDNLILASASPRRAELIGQIGTGFSIVSADIDESILDNEKPEDMVLRLSYEKALKIAKEYPNKFIIAADTTVTLNNEIYGKPEDSLDAKNILNKLSGKTHIVHTGMCVMNLEKNLIIKDLDSSEVTFNFITEQQIMDYIATGECMDKAGAYAIQGISNIFINSIRGNYTTIIGLNVSKFYKIILDNYE